MRRGLILFFSACWVVSVASMGLHPSAQTQPDRQSAALSRQSAASSRQSAAPGGQTAAPSKEGAALQQSEQALVKQYCVTCHSARTKTCLLYTSDAADEL